MKLRHRLLFLVVLAVLSALAGGGRGSGESLDLAVQSVRVVDGDTFAIGKQKFRIWGVDAFELSQKCGKMACGVKAKEALIRILSGQGELSCRRQDTDRYGRTVARCFMGDLDVGGEMVRQGWALPYRRYSGGFYDSEFQEAQGLNAGALGTGYKAPWDFRGGV